LRISAENGFQMIGSPCDFDLKFALTFNLEIDHATIRTRYRKLLLNRGYFINDVPDSDAVDRIGSWGF